MLIDEKYPKYITVDNLVDCIIRRNSFYPSSYITLVDNKYRRYRVHEKDLLTIIKERLHIIKVKYKYNAYYLVTNEEKKKCKKK